MALLRHGGMGRTFDPAYAASTLASFLRSEASSELLLVEVDDTFVEVHGYAKQSSGYGGSAKAPSARPRTKTVC